MTVYRNHYQSSDGISDGFTYHKSRRDAMLAAKGRRPYLDDPKNFAEMIWFHAALPGLLETLNKYAGHPDNG